MDQLQAPQNFPKAGGPSNASFQRRQPGAYPPGAKWHKAGTSCKRPSHLMFEEADLKNHEFMVAFDYRAKDGRIIKMYASYPSSGDFVRDTFLKTWIRHFYELIQEGKPCKLFLDIEWIGLDDPQRKVIHHLVDKLKAYTKVREIRAESMYGMVRFSVSLTAYFFLDVYRRKIAL